MEKNKEWWIKLAAISILVVSLIAMGVLKYKKPETDLSIAVYITIALSIFSIIGFFSKQIKKSLEKNEDTQNVMSKEDITSMIISYAHSQRHNNLRKTNPIDLYKQDTVGSDIIYAIKVNMNLDSESFIIVINASFAAREPVYLKIDSLEEDVENEMNKIARKPKSNTVNEKVVDNESTGIKITTRSTIPLSEEKKSGEAI